MPNLWEVKESNGEKYLLCHPGHILISNERNILDLIALCGENESNRIIFHKENLAPEFYDLKSGLAGIVLQKFSNYYVIAAIVGDFSDVTPRFAELIRESNRGNQLRFYPNLEQAIAWLTH